MGIIHVIGIVARQFTYINNSLSAIIYVIVLDAFLPWETEAQAKLFLSTMLYVIVLRYRVFMYVMFRRVPACAATTCAVRPDFAGVVGKLGKADSRICSKGHESKR